MGQAKRRGTFEQRLALAIDKKYVQALKETEQAEARVRFASKMKSPLLVTAILGMMANTEISH